MNENERKSRAAFQNDVLENPDQLAAFLEIDEMMAAINPDILRNIFYPQNMLPDDLPKLVADTMNDEAETVQIFDLNGKEVRV